MVEMKKAELIFIPSPGLSHLVSTVEMAKLLLDRDDRLAITALIMTLPNDAAVGSYIQKTSSDLNKSPRLRFLNLPDLDEESSTSQIIGFAHAFIDKQTDHVREAIAGIVQQSSAGNESQLAGLVLDIFCTKFIDVGKEFGLPSYVFHTSSASGVGLAHCLVEMSLEGNQDLTQFVNSDVELSVPTFTAPVPAKVVPSVLIEKGPVDFFGYFKRIPELSGIMVNTFYELESHAIDSLNSHGKIPKVYAVGPILNQSNQSFNDDDDDVKKWLDDQPENSVVFLCFGIYGSLDVAQVKEIALALENSGIRFLWSLRNPTTNGGKFATEREYLEQVLPVGFLERTEGVGKVIGWAPQMAALSHAAVGGFVSHCGWNSTLESVWYGVPIAAFPMYAEQHMNAFELVTELEMAEVITLDYHMDLTGEKPPKIVGWEEVAATIKRLMAVEGGSGVRGKVKELHSKARAALVEGGSSYNDQYAFINDVRKHYLVV